MVVDDRVSAVAAPALLRLSEVLKHGYQLQALAGSCRREHIQIRHGRDVGGFVEH
jgi:hypothetical protein